MPQPTQYTLPDHWVCEQHLEQLSHHGFCIIETACPVALFHALQQEIQQTHCEFRAAQIAQGGLNPHIRRDKTRWLTLDDAAGSHYLHLLTQLGQQLNRFLYTGIRRVEAHYATYASGDYYQAHRDNPAQRQDRVISSVLYLNHAWQPSWQGQLHLQDSTLTWHDILPLPNRLVLFQSDLLHEVLPATTARHSIAGWLRQDSL